MNPLAKELNLTLFNSNPVIEEFLSDFGKEVFFPKGILSQSAEAKEKAHKYNATLGIATTKNGTLSLASLNKYFNHLKGSEIFNYASSYGIDDLRSAWKDRMTEQNTSLKDKLYSKPIVTCGITQGLSLCCDLFFKPGDILILPNQIWGNYRLIFATRGKASIKSYEFFNNNSFNLEAFKEAILSECGKNKPIKLLLNFPNNPTGYTVTKKEAIGIQEFLLSIAEKGEKLLLLFDDAYFGLYFSDDVFSESLFTLFCDCHENILAVKLDGATKEFFVWGFRLGFITVANKKLDQVALTAFEKKIAGAVRANVSNCSTLAQNVLLKELQNPQLKEDFKNNHNILKQRALKIKEVLKQNKYKEYFSAYPFNAGYFMLIKCLKVKSEKLRLHLLDAYGVGTISTGEMDLRIAFSCVEEEDIADLFELIYKGCVDLKNSQ